ncbi:MAG: amino acid ABC transporter permease [Pseudomonadota bacterium]
MSYHWDFTSPLGFLDLWTRGVGVTLALGLTVVCLGTLMAVPLVWALRCRFWSVRIAAQTYIHVFRSIPALVLIGTVYFCLPMFTGYRIDPVSTAALALSINLSPFAAECIRSAIQSVPSVQYESALSLGFTPTQTMRFVILPQAAARALPPLAGQWVTSFKLTSLAATISVPELWHATGQVVVDTSRPIEARLIGAALYVMMIAPFLLAVGWLERRSALRGYGGSPGGAVA